MNQRRLAILLATLGLVCMVFSMGAHAAWPTCIENDDPYPHAGTWRYINNQGLGATQCDVPNTGSLGSRLACIKAHYETLCGGCTLIEPTLMWGNPNSTGVTGAGSQVQYRFKKQGTTEYIYPVFEKTALTPDMCPTAPPIECSSLANVKTLGSATGQDDNWTPEDTICVKDGKVDGADVPMEGNGCAAFKTANQRWKTLGPTDDKDWLVQYQFTGLECDDEPEQPETPIDNEDESEKCVSAGGFNWCEAPNKNADCGFFNDQYLCLESLGNNKCFKNADGSSLCVEGAPTPPVPDNGTPGVKAAPDGSMQVIDNDTNVSVEYNYYNSSTNTGSSRGTGSGPNGDGSGTVGPGGVPAGTGSEEGEEGGEGSASGGLDCAAPPTCDGDPIACAQLQQQWRTRCAEVDQSDIETAFGLTEAEGEGDLSAGNDPVTIGSLNADGGYGGACPTSELSFTVKGQTISYNIWEWACQVAIWFAPITMLMGYLAAARIIYRGVT